MPLERIRPEHQPHTRAEANQASLPEALWLIVADGAPVSSLQETATAIVKRHPGSAVLLHTDPTFNPEDLSALAVPLLQVSHGTPLEAGRLHVLPQGRLFVAENGRLFLRPRDAAVTVSALEHLLPSLAASYGDRLQVLLLSDDADDRAAALQGFGVRIHTGDSLLHPAASEPARLFPATLSAASPRPPLPHDLRQPLQTLTLLQNLLQRQVKEPRALETVARLGETLQQLVSMLSQQGVQAPGQPEPSPPAPEAARRSSRDTAPESGEGSLVYIIDDDRSVREAMRAVLEEEGCAVRDFDCCEAFLQAYGGESGGCLLVDAYLPGMSGLELLAHLKDQAWALPAIMITGSSDVQMAVRAMKTGASDFIEKPVGAVALLAGVRQAIAQARDSETGLMNREKALHCLKGLTRRQRQIMAMVLDGHPSKNIAADLGISQRTVENHRAAIMRKTGSRSLPALARLALALPALEIE